MSVRRRAVLTRVQRELTRLRELEKFSRPLQAIQEMCERKIAARETTITAEELSACFADSADEAQK